MRGPHKSDLLIRSSPSHLTPLANVCIYLPFGCLLFVLSYYIWMVRIIALETKWKYFLLYQRPKLFLRVYKNEGTNIMVEGYICWMGWMARIINDNSSQASQDLSFSTLHHSQAHTGGNKMWHCLKFHKLVVSSIMLLLTYETQYWQN